MFLDLDPFKVVNDTCGHAAGDQLLRQTSGLLNENVGTDALLARLGGDEFGVLLRDSDAKSAVEIAERLQLAVQELSFAWNGCVFNISEHRPCPCLGDGQRGGDAEGRGHGLLHGKGERP